jgi:hypothetical protein
MSGARQIATSDGRIWHASQVGIFDQGGRQADWLIMATNEQGQRVMIGLNEPLRTASEGVLSELIERANSVGSFHLWRYRKPGVSIQPPARWASQGVAGQVGIGQVQVGGNVHLRTTDDLGITVRVKEALELGTFLGEVIDVEHYDVRTPVLLGQAVLFHEQQVEAEL